MKRILPLFLFIFAFAMGAVAQENPNRVIVVEKSGVYKGFLVERIDSMFFAQVVGRVAADVEYKGFKTGEFGDTLMLSITKTPECYSYKIDIIPSNRMNFLSDPAVLASYIDQNVTTKYNADYSDAEMYGFDFVFEPDAEYTIATVGFDYYGVACGTSTASFRTPKPAIVGNPFVNAVVTDVTHTSFTIDFTPNSDVSSYAFCSFEAGTAQEQFEIFGAWMGFSTIAEMVYSWGIPETGPFVYTYQSMNPGTAYEVLIAVKDVNGNFTDIITVPIVTESLGGDGVAEVTITVGEFGEQYGSYYQEIITEPNDQTALYHVLLIEKEYFDAEWDEAKVTEHLKSDSNPLNPWDSYWDVYGYDDGFWNADPDKSYYFFAIAKNAVGEWGPLAQVEFTTPTAEVDIVEPAKIMPARRTADTSHGVTRPIFKPSKIKKNTGIILR